MSSLAYFRTRLAHAQTATELPPAARYHLAASNVDDDNLEYAYSQFGGPEYGSSGFGMNEIINELISREPSYMPVTTIEERERKLVASGYLPPDYEPTGDWNPIVNAADRRADRDMRKLAYQGGNWFSEPSKKLFEAFSWLNPTETVRGAFGIAKGIVEDTKTLATNPKEVLEEGGLLGGAGMGVVAGGTVGSIVPIFGTAIGAAVGGISLGVAGFFADLFDEDEWEEEAGTWERIVGALTPIDEIKRGDAKNLYAGLSTVMLASSILKAAGTAIGVGASAARATAAGETVGVRGILASASPTVAGKTISEAGFRQAFKRASVGSIEPGLAARLTRSALTGSHPIAGSAALGGTINSLDEILRGDFEQIPGEFARGAVAGAVGRKVIGSTKAGRRALDLAKKGLSNAPLARMMATPVGRITNALYTGVAPPTIVARLAPGETAVKREIEEMPVVSGPLRVVDVALGSVLFPSRLLPWRSRDLARAWAEMGSEHVLNPIVQGARRVKGQPGLIASKEARARVEQWLTKDAQGGIDASLKPLRVQQLYLSKGLQDEAERLAAGEAFATRWHREHRLGELRAETVKKIFSEAGSSDPQQIANLSPTAQRVMEQAMDNPHSMQAWVEANIFGGEGVDPSRFSDFWKAEELLQEQTARMARVKAAGAATPLDDTGGVRFTVARRGHYVTRQEVLELGGKSANDPGAYVLGVRRYREAWEAGKDAPSDSPLVEALTDAGEDLDVLLLSMRDKGLITHQKYEAIRPGMSIPSVDPSVVEHLREVTKLRNPEVPEMSGLLTRELGHDRFIAIATGENMISHSHIPKLLEHSGVAEYTRRMGFFDSLSSVARRADRADVGALRYNSIVFHLDKEADELINAADGNQVAQKIANEMRARYDTDYAAARGETLSTLLGAIVKRENKVTGETTKEWFKVSPTDLSPEDIIRALDLEKPGVLKEGVDIYEAAHRLKRSIHIGSAFGADIAHPLATARAFAQSLGVNGMPGFGDFIRTLNVPLERLPDALGGARFAKHAYGYLPANLKRAHLAMQFSLNPTYDLSRYVEAGAFGAMNNIPVKAAVMPKRFVHDNEWRSYKDLRPIKQKEAVQESVELGDQIMYGRKVMENFDDLQMRLMNRGIFGFKPREVEYAQAWALAQKRLRQGKPLTTKDLEEIRETVLQINAYGAKQTPFGNTAHFIFFPFLFQGKQLRQIHDFILGAPMRAMLVHEGFRRWYQVNENGESLSSRFKEVTEKHLPALQYVQKLNNFAYGIGPGRPITRFLGDRTTKEGKAAATVAAFLTPGGVHTPLHEAIGDAADLLKHAFVPVVMVDDGKQLTWNDQLLNIGERLAPLYRDIQMIFDEEGVLNQQAVALSGKGGPYSQLTDYYDRKRILDASKETVALGLGYSSWASLAGSSDPGAQGVRNEADLMSRELEADVPQGAELAARFTNTDAVKEQVLHRIARKDDRTSAEDAIFFIGGLEDQAKGLAAQSGITQEEMFRRIASIVRDYALNFYEDRQFMNLWDELFRSRWGTIREVKVA